MYVICRHTKTQKKRVTINASRHGKNDSFWSDGWRRTLQAQKILKIQKFFGNNSAFNNVSRKPTGQLFTCQRKTMPGHTLTLITRIKNAWIFLAWKLRKTKELICIISTSFCLDLLLLLILLLCNHFKILRFFPWKSLCICGRPFNVIFFPKFKLLITWVLF